MSRIITIFFDVGGVCLTNGWDTGARRSAARHFSLDPEELERRHQARADALERGQLSLDAYLDDVIFRRRRSFSRDAFTSFMQAQSQPHPSVLSLIRHLASGGSYKLATINNESRELNRYRIDTFRLRDIFSAFFSSCYLTRGSTRSPSMSCRRSPRPACSWMTGRRTWRGRGLSACTRSTSWIVAASLSSC